ncbi:MAG: peptide transporter [Kiritimatiellae bacterium]|nr:peptide transporter [Kiritimatiellia bacterium]
MAKDIREDKELKEFRDLMPRPDHFESGLGWGTFLMALFVGLLMAPAQLYMHLVAGVGMSDAAKWVTVILYVEVARRAFKELKRPEIFILFYMCGAVVHATGENLLMRQFIVQSESLRKMGLIQYIPEWYAPKDPQVLAQRTFWIRPWAVPLILLVVTRFVAMLDHFGLGYVMYRLAADVEDLPFPMAPVGAMGMTALADASSQKETWRWRVFSMGGVAGVAFGFVYLAIPNITSAIFTEPIRILPIPFVDLTSYTEGFLPAMPMMISFNLAFLFQGMVKPFGAMLGAFVGLIVTLIANPILHHAGILKGWEPGIGAIATIRSNIMDFYFSFHLGLLLAVAGIGFLTVFTSFRKKKREMDEAGRPKVEWSRLFKPGVDRGDIPIWLAICIYLFSTTVYVSLGYWLVNYRSTLYGLRFPLWLLLFYGFVYTPLISYVSTRMEGMVGMFVNIPFVREATFILSGYKGAAIWFCPIPMHNYGAQAVQFRTTELTGARFTSLLKAEFIIFPIMIAGTFMFSQFIWQIDNVPSELFPWANEFWELQAFQKGLIWSATLPGEVHTPFQEAFKPEVILIALGMAVVLYAVLRHFSLPVFLVYGLIYGLDQSLPHAILPQFLGALIGRYGCRKWFGERWPKYRVVFLAGFTAGIGLITMLSLGFVLMSKSVIKLAV